MNANLTENPKLEFKGITIQWERHKNKVICAVYIEGMFNTYGGVARCKDDEFDMVFGMKLSLQRALKDQNKATRETVMEKFGEIYGWGECKKERKGVIEARLIDDEVKLYFNGILYQEAKRCEKTDHQVIEVGNTLYHFNDGFEVLEVGMFKHLDDYEYLLIENASNNSKLLFKKIGKPIYLKNN